jgi:hypothetical protein
MRPAIKAGLMALLEATGLYMRPVLILCLLRKEAPSVTLNRPHSGRTEPHVVNTRMHSANCVNSCAHFHMSSGR